MIQEEKIRLMTAAALLEKNQGFAALEITSYRKKDYLTLHLIYVFLCISGAFALVLMSLLLLSFGSDTELLVSFASLERMGLVLLGCYIGVLIVFLTMAYFAYSKRYESALHSRKRYEKKLAQIQLLYEKPQEEQVDENW